jgi:nucleoside-diphosphate-sugar epimerase
MASYLLTGSAGFIASAVCTQLLQQGHRVVGIDNLNDAYDVRLKEWRLRQVEGISGFGFIRADISDREAMRAVFDREQAETGRTFDAVINLAARA